MDNRQAFKGSKQEEQLFAIERSLTEALKMCQKEIARMSLEKLTLEKHLRIQRELEKVQRPEVLSNLQGPPDLKVNIIPGIDFNMDFTQETLSFEDPLNMD